MPSVTDQKRAASPRWVIDAATRGSAVRSFPATSPIRTASGAPGPVAKSAPSGRYPSGGTGPVSTAK